MALSKIKRSYVEISDVYKAYSNSGGENIPALSGLTLAVEKGEFVSIFGPNGCGKSTLLNVFANLIPYDSGSILIDNRKSSESRIGFVFQNYSESLFPWLSNISNIAFGLDRPVHGKKALHQLIRRFVKSIELEGLPLDKYPYQCSAGQQQLVALVRELMYEPNVLLMDEPFVSLDYDRRLSQQEHLLRSWSKTNATILFVSHEIDEAIYMADRLVLLSQRPASVAASFDILLPRPRTMDMLVSEEFRRLKSPILQAFREITGR